ncbi:MAG TPA: aldo/keto reductase [Polyangiales bacterium]|nr:aldo/keto reductase [Polyangiales bacterium]
MRTRFLGETGVAVSKLAFGTMTFGNEALEQESARIYHAARDAGINLFDCADVYSKGRAEEILGRLIATDRNEIVLATKATFPMSDGANDCGASRYHIVRACEASLRRLGTDRIDIYYLHRFDPRTSLEEALRGLEQLVRQGKILYPALSNFAAWQVQRAIDLQERHGWTKLACIQPMYNLLKRQVEVELLPMAQANAIGVLPYSPLAAGILSGKYLSRESGRMSTNKNYQVRYAHADAENVAARFIAIAQRIGVAPAALALAWVAHHPGVTAPLLGARSVQQLEPLLAAASLELSDALYAEISALTPAPAPATDRHDDGGDTDLWRR